MRLSEVWFKSYCFLIALNRSIQLTELLESDTEVIMRLSVVWFNGERLLITLNRSIQLTEIRESITKVIMCLNVVCLIASAFS